VWFLCEVIYTPLSALIRTSIALFLLRIVVAKAHQLTIYASLTFIWTLSTVYFFIIMFQCNPPMFFYEQVFEGRRGYWYVSHTNLEGDLSPGPHRTGTMAKLTQIPPASIMI
jgi:hypothetical protein